MSDRVSLLRAILASPDDDVPRLVFADWLEEYGATDADAARVEFIRLGCKLKSGKRPISGDQVAWLVDNWPRLLPTTMGLVPSGKPVSVRRKGRFFSIRVAWVSGGRIETSVLHPDFVRGFARRVQFTSGRGYERFRAAVAADEPLATLEPQALPPADGPGGVRVVTIRPDDWGLDVFRRLTGHDEEAPGAWKRFTTRWPEPPPGVPTRQRIQELFRARSITSVQDRTRHALAAAMTAIAREANGLTPTTTELA